MKNTIKQIISIAFISSFLTLTSCGGGIEVGVGNTDTNTDTGSSLEDSSDVDSNNDSNDDVSDNDEDSGDSDSSSDNENNEPDEQEQNDDGSSDEEAIEEETEEELDESDESESDDDSDGSSDGSSDEENSDYQVDYEVGELYAPHIDFDQYGGAGKTSNYRVIGYYMPSLDGSFPPSDIGEEQAKKLTHINFAFIGINADLECDFVEGDDPASTSATIAELQELKSWNPKLKTLFSIGGWAESNDASSTVDRYRDAFKPENIDNFVSSCVDFMEQHDFDGIDIDWEYPRSEDVENFVSGLEEFRDALDDRGDNEQLTIAGAGGAFFMSRYYHMLPEIVENLDFINLMTYDLNGPWQGVTKTNFHAHLYGNSEEPLFYNALREAQLGLSWEEITNRFPSPFALTVDAAIKQHIMTDIPRDKIVMGVPFYGRAFFNTGSGNNGLYQSFNTPGDDPYVGDPSLLTGCEPCEARGEPRIATYREIQEMIDGGYGYVEHFDDETKAPWLHHPEDNIFVTYDNSDSLRYKTDYIKQEGLGGVMFWHLGQDSEEFELLNTLHDELNGENAGNTNSGDESSDDSKEEPEEDEEENTGDEDEEADEDELVKYPAYSNTKVYTQGDRVIYSGAVYEAKWYTVGDIPTESGEWGVWKEVTGVEAEVDDSEEESDEDEEDNNSEDNNSQEEDDEDSQEGTYSIALSELEAKEAELTDSDLMRMVKASIATRDNMVVEQISPLNVSNPENVKLVENIISASDWEFLFPERSPEYTYTNFLKAVGKFPAFCGSYEDGRDAEAICRKSLATMFAHFTQETGGHTSHWDVPEWRQGLVHVREMGWTEDMRGGYNGECLPETWQGQTWPCGTFDNGDYKSYFGRGAKQLSYNYNYGPFSEAMYGDVTVLLDNPELVADTWLNLASAVFFFVYPQPPKPSMLHVIDGTWQPNERDIANGLTSGFGVTTQIINGGVECGGSTEIQQSVNRISYYHGFTGYLNVEIPSNEVLGCAGMKQFDNDGAGALNIFWEQDWSWSADTPDGSSYACKLVGYQTPFSAFKEGDYAACVDHFFDVDIEP